MGTDILPGHTYTDGEFINGPSLTEHVSEATIKPTFYSARTAKDPAVLTDEILVRDTVADAYRKVSLATLQGLMVGPGGVVQTSYSEYTANSDLTAIIPVDDTIPQNTEGTEILTASITPKFSTSRVLVSFSSEWACDVLGTCVAALFRDASAAALAAQMDLGFVQANDVRGIFHLVYMDSPSSTSTLTYRIRIGPGSAGTMRLNGMPTQRYLGGVMRSTLTLQEIK